MTIQRGDTVEARDVGHRRVLVVQYNNGRKDSVFGIDHLSDAEVVSLVEDFYRDTATSLVFDATRKV